MRVRFLLVIFFLAAFTAAAAGRYEVSRERARGPETPELVVLRDRVAGLEAAIAPTEGGELSSFRVRRAGRWIETLYRARDYSPDEGWRGKAPLLWPATGRNVPAGEKPPAEGADFAYVCRGRRYAIPIHGFARAMEWKLKSSRAAHTGAGAVVFITDTPETRRRYPFGFRLTADYRLSDGKLLILYTVAASPGNREEMFFSIGNHITFRVPFLEGSDPLQMRFQTPSTVEYLKVPPGVPTGEQRPASYARPTPLSAFPRRSAVSLGGYKDGVYMVLRDPQGLAIRLTQRASSLPPPPLVRFNIWGDPAAGFFSPEPWVGLQNSLNLQQGLVRLPPGETWTWTVELQPE